MKPRPREEQATARTSYCNIMMQRIQYQEANNRKNTCNSIDKGKSRAGSNNMDISNSRVTINSKDASNSREGNSG
jgi:hypothetical protein